MFVECGNDLFEFPTLLDQDRVWNGVRIEVRDLPPISPCGVQQPIANLAHIAPFPKSMRILGVRPCELRFFTHPCAAESQGSRDGAGAGPMHAEHQKH